MDLSREFFTSPEGLPNVDLYGLLTYLNSARQSVALVERYKETRNIANPEAVESAVTHLDSEAARYRLAVTESEYIDAGYAFANEAEAFCRRLAEASESPETLTQGLRNLSQLAENAHRKSLHRRTGLKETLQNEDQILEDTTQAVAIMENESKSSDSVSSIDQRTLEEVNSYLEKIKDDFGVLLQYVNSLVEWWDNLKQGLDHVQDDIPQIKQDGSNPFRTDNVAERWKAISCEFDRYRKQIANIREFYRYLASGEERMVEGETDVEQHQQVDTSKAEAAQLAETQQERREKETETQAPLSPQRNGVIDLGQPKAPSAQRKKWWYRWFLCCGLCAECYTDSEVLADANGAPEGNGHRPGHR